MGAGKRGVLTAAVTVVCAVTVLAVPGTAFAAPTPPPGPGATASVTVVTSDVELEAVRKKLDKLYRAASRDEAEHHPCRRQPSAAALPHRAGR